MSSEHSAMVRQSNHPNESTQNHENYLVQTLGLVLPAGIVSGRRDSRDRAVVLRAGVLGGGSEVAFG
jgi:hypothetical protein